MTHKRTPGPWKAGNLGTIWTEGCTQLVAECGTNGVEIGEARENAEFIVCACNSFDALLEALKSLLPLARHVSPEDVAVHAAIKAIAQTEGVQS